MWNFFATASWQRCLAALMVLAIVVLGIMTILGPERTGDLVKYIIAIAVTVFMLSRVFRRRGGHGGGSGHGR